MNRRFQVSLDWVVHMSSCRIHEMWEPKLLYRDWKAVHAMTMKRSDNMSYFELDRNAAMTLYTQRRQFKRQVLYQIPFYELFA